MTADIDGDGWSLSEGDCWESTQNHPPKIVGAIEHRLSSSDIYPGAEDRPYDGIDQNCDGLDDFDHDRDGFVPSQYQGISTETLELPLLDGGDCWDRIDSTPMEFRSLNGFPSLSAFDVYPGAEDRPYDGIDANCNGDEQEFDYDRDGWNSDQYLDRNGERGEDCIDSIADIPLDIITDIEPMNCNPQATERWYDGIDQDCDGRSDFDQDGDLFESSQYGGEDCEDSDPSIHPLAMEREVDFIDQNCDGMELCYVDADGDGYGMNLLSLSEVLSCSTALHSSRNDDCDDSNSNIYPWADEDPGGPDRNCDQLESSGMNDCIGRSFGANYFLVCSESQSFFDAEIICQNHNYDGLAEIRSSGEDNLIQTMLVGSQAAFIGLNDIQQEGQYQWRNPLSSLSYQNWSGPSEAFGNNDSCDCVIAFSIGWSPVACSLETSFICEHR